jgi:hypothetical protein
VIDHFTRYFLVHSERVVDHPTLDQVPNLLCIPLYTPCGAPIWLFNTHPVPEELVKTFNTNHGVGCGFSGHRWGSRVSPLIQQKDYGPALVDSVLSSKS